MIVIFNIYIYIYIYIYTHKKSSCLKGTLRLKALGGLYALVRLAPFTTMVHIALQGVRLRIILGV